MCFHMFIGLKLGVKTLPFTLHLHWKKEKVTEFMCVCLRRSSSGLIESDRFVESGKCFYPWDSRWGKWRGRWWKRRKKKNAKNWDMMEITGTALTIPYWRWMFTFFVSYIANARTFFGIPVHKFPFIHLFHFPKPVSVSSDRYITTEDSWEHFTLLKWFKSHEHKLIGAFHY